MHKAASSGRTLKMAELCVAFVVGCASDAATPSSTPSAANPATGAAGVQSPAVPTPGTGAGGAKAPVGASAGTPAVVTTKPPTTAGTTAPAPGSAGSTAMLPATAGSAAPAAAGGAAPGGAAGMMAAAAGSSGMSTIPPATGPAPKLPEIMGDCPELKNGTVMVAGHKGVVLTVGAPGKAGPLVFYWHGTGSTPGESRLFAGTNDVIAAGGIVASFDGKQSSGAEGDCSGTGAHNMADFKAADQIAACAVKSGQVDPRRIYSTGCSAGGLQTGCMAQKRSSYLAAVAPNSGGVVGSQPWQDMHTPAVFTMHGGSSDMVIVTFSQTSATFDMSAKSHGGFVVNCNHNGGHCQAPMDLQAAAWKFMQDHPWGAESPWKSGIPAGVPSYCKIY